MLQPELDFLEYYIVEISMVSAEKIGANIDVKYLNY